METMENNHYNGNIILFKKDLIVWKLHYLSFIIYVISLFKKDLIVWKHINFYNVFNIYSMFKKDLIVWKLKILALVRFT